MLTSQRRQLILRLLAENESVQVSTLAKRFDVSEVTIRRDLDALDGQNGLRRIRGGAMLISPDLHESTLQERQVVNRDEKARIGQAAAELVEDGESIIIGGGTTTAEMAHQLTHHSDLLVITPSINIPAILADAVGVTVLITGGILVGAEQTLAGHISEEALSTLHADTLFVGVAAVDTVHGLTSAHPGEIGVNQAMMRAVTRRIVLADHTKIGRVSTCAFATLSEVDVLITDQQTPPELVTQIKELGVQVILA